MRQGSWAKEQHVNDLADIPILTANQSQMGSRGETRQQISPGGEGDVQLYWTDPSDGQWKPVLTGTKVMKCKSIFPAGRGVSIPSGKLVWVTMVDGKPTAVPLEC